MVPPSGGSWVRSLSPAIIRTALVTRVVSRPDRPAAGAVRLLGHGDQRNNLARASAPSPASATAAPGSSQRLRKPPRDPDPPGKRIARAIISVWLGVGQDRHGPTKSLIIAHKCLWTQPLWSVRPRASTRHRWAIRRFSPSPRSRGEGRPSGGRGLSVSAQADAGSPCHEKEVEKSLKINLSYPSPGLVPGIHVLATRWLGRKTWMAGPSPATGISLTFSSPVVQAAASGLPGVSPGTRAPGADSDLSPRAGRGRPSSFIVRCIDMGKDQTKSGVFGIGLGG